MGNAAGIGSPEVRACPQERDLQTMRALIAKYEGLRGEEGVSEEEMYVTLHQELVKQHLANSGEGNTSKPEGSGKINLLVVDDSHISCKLAHRALQRLNYSAGIAYNGLDALSMLEEHPDSYDLVLLDIVMPGIDGIEVLRRIKQNPVTSTIPVAMLSGLDDQSLAEVCLQQGAVQVLLKPLNSDSVQMVVQEHCMGARDLNHTGILDIGDISPDFTLVDDSGSEVVSSSLLKDGKNLLMAFIPGDHKEVPGLSELVASLLSTLSRHYIAIKSTRSEVVVVTEDASSLASPKGQPSSFQIYTDPSLTAAKEAVGMRDPRQLAETDPGASGAAPASTCNLGAILLDAQGMVLYKWTVTLNDKTPAPLNMAAVFKLLKDQSAEQVAAPTALRHDGRMLMLVVDDSNISSKLALRKLAALGHDTMHAENGQVALELLRRFPNEIDLVLLDIVMPVMDGLELLKLIQGDENLKHIPVIILSAVEDEVLGNVCLEAGAAMVLQKPLNTNRVDALIRERKISSVGSR
ncbi:unnamed protein product [Chrysoparadoxa australica]